MSSPDETGLSQLFASLVETSELEGDLVRRLEATVDTEMGTMQRKIDQLRKAAIDYRAERDILQLVAEQAAQGDIATSGPEGSLSAAMHAVSKMPNVERSCIVLFDEAGQPRLLECRGFERDEERHLHEQISVGIIASVRDTGEAVYSDAAHEEQEFSDLTSVRALGMRTVFCCPVLSPDEDKVLGAMCLENRTLSGAFPPAWRKAVGLLGSQLGLHLALLERRLDPGEDRTLSFRRDGRYQQIVGTSDCTARLFKSLDQLSQATPLETILITGDTGVGKGVAAKALHQYGPRSEEPFVVVNVASLSPNLIESELFGNTGHAFTGARKRRGLFEEAKHGILFLDEIGELPPNLQAKLLRAVEEHKIRSVGSTHEREIDVWIVAATNRDLETEVAEGRFRADLFYRLAQARIHIPPLRERPADIEALFTHFAREFRKDQSKPLCFSPDLIVRLQSLPWPGNVRELMSATNRLMAEAKGSLLTAEHLRAIESPSLDEQEEDLVLTWDEATRQFHRRYLQWLAEMDWDSKAAAAARLGVHKTYLYRLLKKHGIQFTTNRRKVAIPEGQAR